MSQGFVYLMYATSGLYKIGASKDPDRRRDDLSGMPFGVSLAHSISSSNPFWLEKVLHQRFEQRHVRGEWFRLAAEDVTLITSLRRCDDFQELPSELTPDRHKTVAPIRKKRSGELRQAGLRSWKDLRKSVVSRPTPELSAVNTDAGKKSRSVDDVISTAEAAAILGLSERQVRQLVAAGTLPGRRVGARAWVFLRDAVVAARGNLPKVGRPPKPPAPPAARRKRP